MLQVRLAWVVRSVGAVLVTLLVVGLVGVAAPTAFADDAGTRTISGVVYFDSSMTAAQRQKVKIVAALVSPNSIFQLNAASRRLDGNIASDGAVVFDAATGKFSVSGLTPGTYRVLAGIPISTDTGVSGYFNYFYASDSPTSSGWDSYLSSGNCRSGSPTYSCAYDQAFSGALVDVSVTNRSGVAQYLNSPRGRVFIGARGGSAFGGSRPPKVEAVRVSENEAAEIVYASGDSWDAGVGLARELPSGAEFKVRVTLGNGVMVWYDGSPHGTTEASRAEVFTVPKWNEIRLTLDLNSDYSAPLPFKDVASSVHLPGITWMWNEGYLASATEFRPQSATTRGAMATMLMRIKQPDFANWKPSAATVKNWPYTDVKPGDTHYQGIAWMYEHGYAVSAKKYNPTNPTTRGAMASFLQRIEDPGYVPQPSTLLAGFSDVTPSSEHYTGIAWLAEHGYVAAAPKYNTTTSTTRGAMATFLYRIKR